MCALLCCCTYCDAACLPYCRQPQDTDSAGQKLGGALLNAIIFMAVIAGMTFVLFLLFKWGVSGLWPCSSSSCTDTAAAAAATAAIMTLQQRRQQQLC